MENNMNELNLEDLNKVAGGAGKKRKKTKKKLPVEVFSGTQKEYQKWLETKDLTPEQKLMKEIDESLQSFVEKDDVKVIIPPLNGIL